MSEKSQLGMLLGRSACGATVDIPQEISWLLLDCDVWMFTGGRSRALIDTLLGEHPIALSGRGMNLASVDPMDFAYLKTLSRFAEETQAMWASDRLAFCGLDDRIFPQTFPMPYSEELLSHVVSRIAVVRDILELPFLVENIATHAGTSCDTMFSNKKGRMSEVEFITQVLERADCRMFLNLTAFMITAMEQNANPVQLVAQLPLERLSALRICGHVVQSGFLVESDTAALSRELCDVLEAVIARLPNPVPIVWARDSSTGIPRSELSRISGMLEHNFARQSERGQDQGLET